MKQIQLLLLAVLVLCTSLIIIDFKGSQVLLKKQFDIEEMTVEDMLLNLGDDTIQHHIGQFDAEKAAVGKDLIMNGFTIRDGKKSQRISKHFVCTDCHNLTRESMDLTLESPKDRLNYAKEAGLNFLPGSTLWGIYDRTSFYNKDYIKKYGDLVLNARDTLSNAVQLCAKYCSSGRYLDSWELESIMHYFKTLQLKVRDLHLAESVLNNLRQYATLKPKERVDMIEEIKKAYNHGFDATFGKPIAVELRKYGEGGDAANGELIYEKSCLHCHGGGRLTYLNLSKSKLDARMFWKNRSNYRDKSIYQIIRYGTYSKTGRKQYMPLYTEEKMSDDQINDLMAYIKQLAGK